MRKTIGLFHKNKKRKLGLSLFYGNNAKGMAMIYKFGS